MKKILSFLLQIIFIAAFISGSAFAQTGKKREDAPPPPLIAASSDLQQILPTIARLFEQAGGGKVALNFDSAGNIYREIEKGVPVELFLTGGDTWSKKLSEEGKVLKGPQAYAVAHLALYTPRGSTLKADAFLGDIRSAVREERLHRLIVADPEQSNYGRLVKEALERKRVWDEIQSKLIVVDNVAQTVQAATTQNAEGALIAYVDAKDLVRVNSGRAVRLSDVVCPPMTQEMVLLKGASPTAQQFFGFMRQREIKKLLLDYGFQLPGGETVSTLGY
jgi:molybdenum ABC transporter, periplasmic molybdate-binding protein